MRVLSINPRSSVLEIRGSLQKTTRADRGPADDNGGTIVLPKMLIPTVGYIMLFRDTEGNVAGVAQYEPNSRADQ